MPEGKINQPDQSNLPRFKDLVAAQHKRLEDKQEEWRERAISRDEATERNIWNLYFKPIVDKLGYESDFKYSFSPKNIKNDDLASLATKVRDFCREQGVDFDPWQSIAWFMACNEYGYEEVFYEKILRGLLSPNRVMNRSGFEEDIFYRFLKERFAKGDLPEYLWLICRARHKDGLIDETDDSTKSLLCSPESLALIKEETIGTQKKHPDIKGKEVIEKYAKSLVALIDWMRNGLQAYDATGEKKVYNANDIPDGIRIANQETLALPHQPSTSRRFFIKMAKTF